MAPAPNNRASQDRGVDSDVNELIHEAVPKDVPTLVELKRVLGNKCFESDPLTSLYYAAKDLIIIASLYALAAGSDKYLLEEGSCLRYVLWPAYWFLQGTMMWAIFVVAHDCGHGSFSKYELLNDVVGNILNTFILVPYYAWKLSHKHHHKNTGNIDKDEVYYPVRKEDPQEHRSLYFGFGIGWFVYLTVGYRGRGKTVMHFDPRDDLFKGHAKDVAISVLCWIVWAAAVLPFYVKHFGLADLVFYYLIPVFVFASWLVVVTFLHHHDVHVPWYSDGDWDFVRGNLSSVDRHYGWAHNLTHNIGTHQLHHLFIKIPHYRLEEATRIFREKYPHLIRVSPDGILTSFVKMCRIFYRQSEIAKDTKIHVYTENDIKKIH